MVAFLRCTSLSNLLKAKVLQKSAVRALGPAYSSEQFKRQTMAPAWFIGVPVGCEDGCGAIQVTVPEGIRRFHKEDLHFTVAFLGSCGEEKAMAAWKALQNAQASPFHVKLGRLRAMGGRIPSAYAATIGEGNEAVADFIAKHRDTLLTIAGARPDPRPPLPHMTVARPGRRPPADVLAAAESWMESQDLSNVGEVSLDRLALFTWNEDRSSKLFKIVTSRLLFEQQDCH